MPMHDDEQYFDVIANGYEQLDTGNTPIRRYCEVYTLLQVMGPLSGASVLHLACSDGFFSRLLKQAGVASLIGVDLSPRMIEIARAHESATPLGIEYRVDAACEIGVLGVFDIVFSSFLMSYARTREELLAMCRIMFANLKPGGRLISMNDNPHMMSDSETGFAKYGKTKRIGLPVQDGARIEITWFANDKKGEQHELHFECQYFTQGTFEWALTQAGFTQIRFHNPRVSPEGLDQCGADYWALFLKNPLLVFIECRKPA